MRDRVLREAGAVALLLGAVLVAVALLSHSPMDPSPFHASTLRSSPNNWAGWLGAEYGPIRAGGEYAIPNINRLSDISELDHADRETLRQFLSRKFENDQRSP